MPPTMSLTVGRLPEPELEVVLLGLLQAARLNATIPAAATPMARVNML